MSGKVSWWGVEGYEEKYCESKDDFEDIEEDNIMAESASDWQARDLGIGVTWWV